MADATSDLNMRKNLPESPQVLLYDKLKKTLHHDNTKIIMISMIISVREVNTCPNQFQPLKRGKSLVRC